jgi:hypothetical protein
MHQPVPQLIIIIYHKKVHQPCTNLYLNLYSTYTLNKCINHAPTCTRQPVINLRKHHQKNLSSLKFQPSLLHLPSKIRLRYPLVTSVTYRYSIRSSVIKMREPYLLLILSCIFLKGLPFNHLNPVSLF